MRLYNGIGPNPRTVRMFLREKGIEVPFEEIDRTRYLAVGGQDFFQDIDPFFWHGGEPIAVDGELAGDADPGGEEAGLFEGHLVTDVDGIGIVVPDAVVEEVAVGAVPGTGDEAFPVRSVIRTDPHRVDHEPDDRTRSCAGPR